MCALISPFPLTFSLALEWPTLSAFALPKDSRTKSALDLLKALPRAVWSGLSSEKQPQLSSKSCFTQQLKATFNVQSSFTSGFPQKSEEGKKGLIMML